MQQPPNPPRRTSTQRPAGAARPSNAQRPAGAPRTQRPTGAPRPNSAQRPSGAQRPANGQRPVARRPANPQGTAPNRRPAPRPANVTGQRPAYNASQPRRPMTRQQYEALQQQRRMQNIRSFAILGGIALVLIVAVVLILMPHPSKDVPVQAVSTDNAMEGATAVSSSGGGVNLDDPRDSESGTTAVTLSADNPLPTVTAIPTPRPGGLRSVHMRVIGDVLVCQSQLDAYKATGYDFHPEFDYIADMLKNADYTMANMEGTVGQYNDKKYSGYPLFNCPETILEALKDSGVDFLTLANNHMLDRWFNGVKNTVNWVKQYGFDYVGAYLSPEERKTPVIYEVGGIRIGFVAYTHTTNTQEKVSDADAVEYGVPYLYKSDIEADIKRLRDAGAEVVIAFPHWGKEYVREPDDNQTKYAKKLAAAGADIILGSHSHTVQPMGYQSVTDANGRTRQVFITFSLGNFLSDHVLQYTDGGVIVDFTINENQDGTFTCDNVGYIPTYCWQPTEGDVRILPSGKYLSKGPAGMSDEAHDRLVQTYQEITEIVGTQFPVLDG